MRVSVTAVHLSASVDQTFQLCFISQTRTNELFFLVKNKLKIYHYKIKKMFRFFKFILNFFKSLSKIKKQKLVLNTHSSHDIQNDSISNETKEEFYLSEVLADFHFIFELADGQYERIPVHKILLAITSDVFRVMFNGSWRDKNEVEIIDASTDAFKEFLQFFYLRQSKISTEHVDKLMYLGDKYNVTKCLRECEVFIMSSLDKDNIFEAYELAILFDRTYLKKHCEMFIGCYTKFVFKSEHFLTCDSKLLCHILKLDLFSYSESKIFKACMKWIYEWVKSNMEQLTRDDIQAQIDEILKEICFESITQKELDMIIHSDEFKSISSLVKLPEFQSNIFSKEQRMNFDNFLSNKEYITYCDRLISKSLSNTPYFIKSIEKTTFSINQPLFFVGFACNELTSYENNNYYYTNDLPSEISIVQIPNSKQSGDEINLFTGEINLQSIFRYYHSSRPILMKPGLMYQIQLKQSPPPNCCTGAMMKSEVQINPNITVQFHGDPIEDFGGVTKGMIRCLYFIRNN